MKSFQMKALALATLGLGGLVMAGGAFAATCPTAVTTPGISSPGGGGAWSSQGIINGATLNIVNPGLANTGCALSVSVGTAANSRAYVQDNSPNNEQRYRARFYFNAANLSGFTASNMAATLFRANDTSAPSQFSSDQLVIRLAGGSPATVRFVVSDANSASGATQIAVPLPTAGASGAYRVEFDMQIGAGATNATHGCDAMPSSGGCIRAWVTAAENVSSDTAPDASATINNSGWSGAKTAYLGLQVGSANFRATQSGKNMVLDEFDSRRQTFIGQ